MQEMNNNGFPTDFVPQKEKLTKKYGLSFARSIFVNFLGNNSTFREQVNRYRDNRRYAEGLQSVDKFKDQLGFKDTNFVSMDWSIISMIPVFVDLMVGEMINADFKISADAIDPTSLTEKDKERARLLTNMELKSSGLADYIKGEVGVSMVREDEYIPENKDEVDLHIQMNFKLAKEIAVEEFIKYVFQNNKDKELKRKIYRDLVVLKKGVGKISINEHDEIEVRYVDPVNFITSFSSKDDFSDIKFAAEITYIDISELRRQANGELSEPDLFEIAAQYSGQHNNPQLGFDSYESYYNNYGSNYNGFDNFLIPVLDFQFISTDYKKYVEKPNKYGGIYFDEKSMDYSTEDESKKVFDKEIDHKYGGKWVLNSNHIYAYGILNDNIRRHKGGVYSGETELDYVVFSPNQYEMENKSIVERMKPHQDAIQRVSLKMQHFINKLKPNGIAVDVGSLHDVFLGKTVESDPLEIQDFYEQTGTFYYNSKDENGVYSNRPPIQEIKQSIGGALQELIQVFEFERSKLKDISGISPIRDGVSVQSDVSYKTQQLSLASSRNSTQELVNGFLGIYTRIADKISYLIIDLINENRIDAYTNVIGKVSVETLKLADGKYLPEFGINLEALPDATEKEIVEQNIQQSLQQKELRIEDAIQVRELMKTSIKKANQWLVLKRKQYQRELTQEANSRSETQAKIQAQVAEQANKMKLEAQKIEMEKLKLKYQLEDLNAEKEHLRKLKEIQLEGEIKSRHIDEASDENFKDSELTQSVKQPRTFDSETGI